MGTLFRGPRADILPPTSPTCSEQRRRPPKMKSRMIHPGMEAKPWVRGFPAPSAGPAALIAEPEEMAAPIRQARTAPPPGTNWSRRPISALSKAAKDLSPRRPFCFESRRQPDMGPISSTPRFAIPFDDSFCSGASDADIAKLAAQLCARPRAPGQKCLNDPDGKLRQIAAALRRALFGARGSDRRPFPPAFDVLERQPDLAEGPADST